MYPMHPEDADFTYSSEAEIDRAFARSGCDPDAAKCVCRGSGWIASERDALYTCLIHFTGQPAEPEEEQQEPLTQYERDELEAEWLEGGSGTHPSLPF